MLYKKLDKYYTELDRDREKHYTKPIQAYKKDVGFVCYHDIK